MRPRLVLFCILAFCLAWPAASSSAQQKIGFVNPQRVINESKIGQVAQADLNRLGKEKDRRIREKALEISTLKKEIAGGKLAMTEQRIKEDSLRVHYEQYDKLIEESNAEIQREEAKLIRFLMRKADRILKDLAAKNGFTLILTDPDSIGYIEKSADITDQVIRELDRLAYNR